MNTLQRNVENQNILALFDVKKENIACDVDVKVLLYCLYDVKKENITIRRFQYLYHTVNGSF